MDTTIESISHQDTPLEQLTKEVGHQECWEEVTGGNRITLEKQLREYESFNEYCNKPHGETASQKDNHVNSTRKVLDADEHEVGIVTNTLDIQQQFIIGNVNEFRLRDNPSMEDFDKILADYSAWMGRGGYSEILNDQIQMIVNLAKQRFIEIKKAI